MKHLIILFLLTLPLIACKSVNTYQQPPEPPGDPGQKPDETPEDPVVSTLDTIVARDLIEIENIVAGDLIEIENNDPKYVTYTFTKTYPFEKRTFAIGICNKLNSRITDLMIRYGKYSTPSGFSVPTPGKCSASYYNNADRKIKADFKVEGIMDLKLTLPKGVKSYFQLLKETQ